MHDTVLDEHGRTGRRRAADKEKVLPLPPLLAGLSTAAAVLGGMGSVFALLMPAQIYGQETAALRDAAIAQDVVNAFLVAPLMLILTVRASKGVNASGPYLAGFLSFTAYNYAIYAFSVHFGPLFLLWVAVLGAASFALAGTLVWLIRSVGTANRRARATRLPGWFLILTAGAFGLLWLSEIVPDIVAGGPSTSASAWSVPTNPVHVLDLALFLPAVFASGVLLLRGRFMGHATAGGALVFLVLTSLPILVTPFVAQAQGRTPEWIITAPIGTVALASLLVLWRLRRSSTPRFPSWRAAPR